MGWTVLPAISITETEYWRYVGPIPGVWRMRASASSPVIPALSTPLRREYATTSLLARLRREARGSPLLKKRARVPSGETIPESQAAPRSTEAVHRVFVSIRPAIVLPVIPVRSKAPSITDSTIYGTPPTVTILTEGEARSTA